jgi:hypothetical protein
MPVEAVIVVGVPTRAIQRLLDSIRASGIHVHEITRHGRGPLRATQALRERRGIQPAEILVVDTCGACAIVSGSRLVVASLSSTDLAEVLRQRKASPLPTIPADPRWVIEVRDADPALERMHDTWLAMVDGVVGTLGSPLTAYGPARREVRVGGVYSGSGPDSDLLRAPDWTRLAGELAAGANMRRVLDLRTGFVHHEARSSEGAFRAVTFASRSMPGVGVMRALGEGARPDGRTILARDPMHDGSIGHEPGDRPSERREVGYVTGVPGGVAVAALQETGRGRQRRLGRLAAYVSSPGRTPPPSAARALLERAHRRGIDRLLAEQRAAWARRWSEMGVVIDGDDDLQRAINFALFHLDASIGHSREAPLGPRGLSGPSYKGHVFWDSEVFMLPFFAATRPAAARAMLTYRVSRLGAAQAAAREAGLRGAWFPWESAADGRDVTPAWVPGPTAQPIRVWTGERELHIVADIAWAAREYVAWSGDEVFAAGDGRRLLIETARFWASRLEREDDGRAHLRGIIGPDEYHELVDDNAFTNVMARWNLRAAAAAVEAGPAGRGADDEPGADEVSDWLALADDIVDGYDPATRLYEQFAGFHGLEPIIIAELEPRPAWADVLLGREHTSQAQVVKQTDVLLLHHMVPDEVEEGSLETNLAYYEPRTAHGSSLSPATHAGLLARVGEFDKALEALHMAAFLDLDDRNGTASEGLHIQTMGGLWQALALGFGGIRPSGDVLIVDPRLPPRWSRLEIPVMFRGSRLHVIVRHGSLTLRSTGVIQVTVPGAGRLTVTRKAVELRQADGGWILPSA